ncbi:unnamed protein product, partial [marine sediment metagenome]
MTKITHFWAFFTFVAFSLGLSNCRTVKNGLDEKIYNG